MPGTLVGSAGQGGVPLAGFLATDQPLPTVTPIIATVLWCAPFAVVAVMHFRREEFEQAGERVLISPVGGLEDPFR